MVNYDLFDWDYCLFAGYNFDVIKCEISLQRLIDPLWYALVIHRSMKLTMVIF